jgi:hypothetical protein
VQLRMPLAMTFSAIVSGSPTWTRTRDLRINSPSLYQLSYQGIVLRVAFLASTDKTYIVCCQQ